MHTYWVAGYRRSKPLERHEKIALYCLSFRKHVWCGGDGARRNADTLQPFCGFVLIELKGPRRYRKIDLDAVMLPVVETPIRIEVSLEKA